MACKRKVVNVLMVLKLIDSDDSDDENTRGKTRDWIKRRDNKGYFNNIVKELKMEDTRGFVKMTRMNFEHFNEVLKAIETLLGKRLLHRKNIRILNNFEQFF